MMELLLDQQRVQHLARHLVEHSDLSWGIHLVGRMEYHWAEGLDHHLVLRWVCCLAQH